MVFKPGPKKPLVYGKFQSTKRILILVEGVGELIGSEAIEILL